MLVKTFQADDMPAALRMVKAEFGANAMIINSRKEQKRGFLGFNSRPFFEVTAALERTPRSYPEPKAEKEKEEPNTLDEFQKSMLYPLARELKELRAKVEQLTQAEREHGRRQHPTEVRSALNSAGGAREASTAFPNPVAAGSGYAMFVPAAANTPAGQTESRQQQVRQAARKPLDELVTQLREQGIGEPEIGTLLGSMPDPGTHPLSSDQLKGLFKKAVATHVRCAGPSKVRKDNLRIMALVGPTGVGKTTTIAKLAALACKQGVKVALITIDTFRIGAVEQLKTYSDIMKVPLEVATTPTELAKALALHGDKNLILIDTSGRSPRDRAKLLEMKEFLAVNPAIETHLCLSAITRERALAHTINRFGVLPVKKVLFTKLDESESFGSIVNVQLRDKLPLSFFTTGQRVPEDIEAATSARVADLILREMKS